MISRGTEATCFVLTLCFSSLFFTYPLLNIHFFLQDPIQECRFHIHLMHLPFTLSRYCQQQTNCFSSDQNFHHSQYHTSAYSLLPRLVPYIFPLHHLNSASIRLIYPFDSKRFLIFWRISKLPSFVSFTCIYFLINCCPPFLI